VTETPYARSEARTRAILDHQASGGSMTRSWEFELARVLGVKIPDRPIEKLLDFWNASVAKTPFPDGVGPWGMHPVWEEESYGIGHTRSFVRALADDGLAIPRDREVIGWLRGLQGRDGRIGAHDEFERLYRERHPEQAARRDAATRAGWTHALEERRPAELRWAHSDLEDAWCAIDALMALETGPADADATVRWLRGRQRPDGGFRATLQLDGNGDVYGHPLSDTMYATRALAACEAAPADSDACVAWLLRLPVTPAIVPQWWRIEALAALGALDRLAVEVREVWERLVFSEDETARQVDVEAHAAVRAHTLLAQGG
jgi:hypothetical protein